MSNSISYSVKPSKMQGSVAILSYAMPDDRGVARLVNVRFNTEAMDEMKRILLAEAPVTVVYRAGEVPAEMQKWVRKQVAVKDITELDLSFARFWDDYGKKVGNKSRVEKKWNALPQADKIMALGVLPRIKRYYAARRLDLPYAETFLDQRRYENLFED